MSVPVIQPWTCVCAPLSARAEWGRIGSASCLVPTSPTVHRLHAVVLEPRRTRVHVGMVAVGRVPLLAAPHIVRDWDMGAIFVVVVVVCSRDIHRRAPCFVRVGVHRACGV